MFCKYCGKEIKDGVSFCPMCGKPTGTTTKNPGSQPPQNAMIRFKKNKKPNPKWILALLGGAAGVVVLVSVIGGISRKFSPSNHSQSAEGSETAAENYTEDPYTESFSTENEDSYDYKDKKWTKKKSYKKAYEEEYDSFEERLQEYCRQQEMEYREMVDEVADGLNEAYERLEKEVPGLSSYIGLDAGNAVSNSFTGVGIISALTEKAVSNEEVRKIGFQTMLYAGTALFDWAMNYTSTNYPFGFQIMELNGDYALLKSNGTYNDMQTIIRNNMSYDTKIDMLQDRISELEDTAGSLISEEDEDAYAECMGRLAANIDKAGEINETYNHYMTVIACSGNGYCLEEEIKLYWLVGKDGTIYNTFWAPAGTRADSWNFDISLCENGSCILEKDSSLLERNEMERFVIDKTGTIVFEGNAFGEREEEPVGESIICTYGPSGNALRETKVKDSTYGTYYTIEFVKENGKAKKLLDIRNMLSSSPKSGPGVPDSGYNTVIEGSYEPTVLWKDYMSCSDYTLLTYESLENQEEQVVIDLNTGEMYDNEEFEESVKAEASKENEDDFAAAQNGTLKEGWLWNAQNEKILVHNTSIFKEKALFEGFSDAYSELNLDFNAEALLQKIGESRELVGCYCQDNVLWVVTRSGYFYTYDLKSSKKTEEVDVGENAPYAFTPYGLVVYGESGKRSADVEYDSTSGQKTEYCIYQYDASGKCIAKYPAYSNDISSLNDYIFGFLYCSGQDTYNLSTQGIYSL